MSGGNFVINTEVWNEIVSWWWFNWCFNSKRLSVLSFGFTNVKISHFDIVINTEVWNKVVSWWCFWLIKGSIHLDAKSSLALSNILLSSDNIVINSEIFDGVVDWPCWFLPSGTRIWRVPWSRSWSWSIGDLSSSSILWKESKGSAHLHRFKHF